MKQFLSKLFFCYILGDHNWTSKSTQGIEPDLSPNVNRQQLIDSFNDHARMYCSRCRKESRLNERYKLK